MKLIVDRHGKTIENEQGICQGQTHGRLSKKGLEQAEKLAQRLKAEKLAAIYSSDLARAADTARIIAGCHPQTPLYFTAGLRERDHGKLTGMKKSDIKDYDADGESVGEMYARVKKVLDQAYEKYHGLTVLFVAHGAINAVLTALIKNMKPDQVEYTDIQPNTGINIFEIKEDKQHQVVLLNCTRHLLN